jgi:hypothetical protein
MQGKADIRIRMMSTNAACPETSLTDKEQSCATGGRCTFAPTSCQADHCQEGWLTNLFKRMLHAEVAHQHGRILGHEHQLCLNISANFPANSYSYSSGCTAFS